MAHNNNIMLVYQSRVHDSVMFDACTPNSLAHTYPGVLLVLHPAQGPGTGQNPTCIRVYIRTYISTINFVFLRNHTLTPVSVWLRDIEHCTVYRA